MKVFVTGATGFIGSAIVQDLLMEGHRVYGLAHSDAAAASLGGAGAGVCRGDLEDLESLRSAAAGSDGVIHAGFIQDFSRFKEACEIDRRAIEALGSALVGSERPLIVTSATTLVSSGRIANEDDAPVSDSTVSPRAASEEAAKSLEARGVRVSVVRNSPSVHGNGDHGFLPALIGIAREKGVSAYVGDGLNRWTAVHRFDAAHLYRLALEKGSASARYHAVGEPPIAFRDIAELIGSCLNVPVVSKSTEEAEGHFGFLAAFAGLDCPASSRLTQERLGWRPLYPGLLSDLKAWNYFAPQKEEAEALLRR
jgi:nucleoside-diphosphate-sugar epimerase